MPTDPPRSTAPHRTRRTVLPVRELMSPHLTDYAYGLVFYVKRLDVWTRPGVTPAERRDLAALLEQEAATLRLEAYRQDGQDRPVTPDPAPQGQPGEAPKSPRVRSNDW